MGSITESSTSDTALAGVETSPSTSRKEPYPSISLDMDETVVDDALPVEKTSVVHGGVSTEIEPSNIPQPDSPGHVDGGDRDGTRIYAGPFSEASSTTIASVPSVNGFNYQTRPRRGQQGEPTDRGRAIIVLSNFAQ